MPADLRAGRPKPPPMSLVCRPRGAASGYIAASLPGALLAEQTNGSPANAAGTLETPPLAHYPVSPRINSARNKGADLIEPAA